MAKKVKAEVRKEIEHLHKDRIITNDINAAKQLVDSDRLLKVVEKFVNLR